MNEVEEIVSAPRLVSEYSALDRLLRRQLIERLKRLEHGTLVLEDACGTVVLGDTSSELRACVRIHDPAVYRVLAMNGTVGAGEAYIQQQWQCDDLVSLTRLFVRNREMLDGMESGSARAGAWALKAWQALRPNTRRGSRANIAAHYDLGNEFFALFLSPDLMYSSALWSGEGDTLERASTRKLDAICTRLELAPGDRLLEIGTGWGGLALHAAGHYGCHVTTTTISREQYELAQERVARAGLTGQVTLLLEDYRDLRGEYDALVSIEMIEAVGHQYLDTYFRQCSSLLKTNGAMLLQAITIRDQFYDTARRSVDFIKRFIFPGSFIPSVKAIAESLERATDLKIFHMEDIGPHYARTLKIWRERFLARQSEVRALGYPEAFVRMWEYYLCYCEGGFEERQLGDVQMLLTKPLSRRAPVATVHAAPP